MTREGLTRRDVLKLAGVGGVAAAVLSGCGPLAKHVRRHPYHDMPEYALPGKSVYFATTCRECPAGCGLVVRTVEGRAIKIEGNPNHPVNRGATCARGQAALEGLYNPDRARGPKQRGGREISWDQAVDAVAAALQETPPEGIAFLLGLAPDHLAELVYEITQALGAPPPLRFGGLAMMEARETLTQAAEAVFGQKALPTFDIARADLVISFGANFMETWLSPVAYAKAYGAMRQGHPGRRGVLVQVEPRMSMTASNADLWLPAKPGTEGLVALALGRLMAEVAGVEAPAPFADVDPAQVAEQAEVPLAKLEKVARYAVEKSESVVAIPGGVVLGYDNGADIARAVLALNALMGDLGKASRVFFTPPAGGQAPLPPASFQDVRSLVDRMKAGKVQVLFIHGVNPVYELPEALGFADALLKVPLVISFSSFDDETARYATYHLPDHTFLESWGYQRVQVGADREVLSAFQPVVVPVFDTRATADVLLAAVQKVGGALAEAVPYKNEVEFIQKKVADFRGRNDGIYQASNPKLFWAFFLQHGGWWTKEATAEPVQGKVVKVGTDKARFSQGDLHLVVYPHPLLGDGSQANYPWLQETPDPMTTVMWNTWVEINPMTAAKLGLENDDVVRIVSPYGAIEAVVYLYPGIRPDTIAVPMGQGHTALGRWAKDRGANPVALLGAGTNAAGDAAFAGVRVRVYKTGRRHQLARKENVVGVYGDGRRIPVTKHEAEAATSKHQE